MLKNNCIHPTQIALKLNWTTLAYLQLEMINQHLGHSCQVHNSVLPHGHQQLLKHFEEVKFKQ